MKNSHIANDYAHEQVPKAQRRTWLSLFAIWTASIICVPVFLMSVQMAEVLTIQNIIFISLCAGLIYTSIAYLLGPICQKTRLPTGQIARMAFGSTAGKVVAFIISFNLFGWFGIQLEFFASGLNIAIQDTIGVFVHSWILILFGGFLMILTSTIGYKALEKLSYITIPLMLLILIWPFVYGSAGEHWESIVFINIQASDSVGTMLGVYIGAFSAGLAISPDLFRYMKNSKHGTLGIATSFLVAAPFVFFIMAYFHKMTGHNNVIDIFFALGLGVSALILVMLSAWTTNDSNLYAASLGLSSIFSKVKKWKISIISGLLGIGLALFGILSNFMEFLTYLGIIMLPITAVFITDFFFSPQCYTSKADKHIPYRFINIASLLVGILVGLSSGVLNYWALTTVAPIDGFISTFLCVCILNKFHKKEA